MDSDKKTKKKDHDLFTWCLEQAADRFTGKLSQDKIEKLDSIGFPWELYEQELDKLGYYWKKNNPNGIRYKDLPQSTIKKSGIEGVKILTEEESKLQGCHYPTPDIHRCANAEPCGFNDPSTDNYLTECTCCEGYCASGDDGEECTCEQTLRLMDRHS